MRDYILDTDTTSAKQHLRANAVNPTDDETPAQLLQDAINAIDGIPGDPTHPGALNQIQYIQDMIAQAQKEGLPQSVVNVLQSYLKDAQNDNPSYFLSQTQNAYNAYLSNPTAGNLSTFEGWQQAAMLCANNTLIPLGVQQLYDNANQLLTDAETAMKAANDASSTLAQINGLVSQIQNMINSLPAGTDPAFIAELENELSIAQKAQTAASNANSAAQSAYGTFLANLTPPNLEHSLVKPITDADATVDSQLPIAQQALATAQQILKALAVTNPDNIGSLNGYQATFAAAGLITLLQFLVDNDNNGSTDNLQLLIRAKLDELKENPNLPTIDGTNPPATAADWITQAENSKTKADFEWWKVSTTTTDGSGKQTTVQGPIGLLIADLSLWDKDPTIQQQLLAPQEGDDGFYTFATTMLFVGIGARTEGSVSNFSEDFMGAEDSSGSTQYFYASRAIAYYLSTQTTQAGGPLSTADLQAFVTAINYGPNGNTWDQTSNPFGSQPNAYLFFYGSDGTPYDPTHDPHTSKDGLIAYINDIVANGGKWNENDGPTTPKNYVIIDADAAWGSFVNGTSQHTTPAVPTEPLTPAKHSAISNALLTNSIESVSASKKAAAAPATTTNAVSAAATVASDAASAVNSDGSWPTPDPSDGGLPSWFDTDVYDNDNYTGGSDPSANNTGKLRRMVEWMQNHPWNKEAPLVFAQYVSNLIQDGKVQTGSDMESYLNSLTVNGKSIIDNIIDLVVTQKFYQEQDPNWDPTNLFNNLQNLFGGDQSFSQDASEYIADWKSRWSNFVQTNAPGGAFNYTADEYNDVASGNWGDFILNAGVGPWGKQIMIDMMNGLVEHLLSNPNANIFLLITLLLFLMTEQSTSDDLGGLGAGSNRLQSYITQLGKISNAWSDGSCASDSTSANNWVDSIQQFEFQINNDPSMTNLKGDLDGALDGNTGLLSQQSPYCDANGNPLTLEDLHDNPTATLYQKDPSTGKVSVVTDGNTPPKDLTYMDGQLKTIQDWQINQQGTSPPPEQYGTTQNDFKGAQSSMSTQASTTATSVQQKTSYMSSVESSMKSFTDNFTTLGNAIVQNQRN